MVGNKPWGQRNMTLSLPTRHVRFQPRLNWAVPTAILFFCGGAFQAHAADVVSATGSLTQLSYTLTDLDLTDGVKASVAFAPNNGYLSRIELSMLDQTFVGAPLVGNRAYVEGSVFNSGNATLTKAGIDATASKIGKTLSIQAKYGASEAQSLLTSPYAANGGALLSYTRQVGIAPYDSVGSDVGEAFVLAPHSSITFTAQFTATTNIDLASLVNTPAFLSAQALGATVYASAWTSGQLSISQPFGSVMPTDDSSLRYRNVQASATLDSLGHVLSDGTQSQIVTTLTTTLSNTSDKAITSALFFSVSSELHMAVNPVPEPATWMLMGMGLAGLVAVSGRRLSVNG